MKVSEYNQMMKYLTRPGRDNLVKPKASLTDNISSKSKSSPGNKSLAKHTAMMKRVISDAKNGKTPSVDFKLAEAGFESSIPDALSKGQKIMVDRSSPTGFTTMDPQDFNDVNRALNKYRRPDDQLKVYDRYDKSTYPSDPKQREKLFEPILDRLQNKKIPAKKSVVETKPTQLSDTSLLNELEEIRQLNEQSRLAEEQFKQLTKNKYDPDLDRGLGYLMGVTEKETT